jgi:hypothetical protein
MYICHICKGGFNKAQALGGHMSKAHPLMSKEFVQKLQKRKEREPQRELLKRAKGIYYEKYGYI